MATEPDLSRIATTDGVSLEAEAHLPENPRAAMVITHPHPKFGGTMYAPIPATILETCEKLGVAALRFNFRGVGASTGDHDDGKAERLDVAAALQALRAAVGPDVALGVGGWSFGADVALAVDASDLAGWFGVAAPLAVVEPAEMAAPGSAKPTLLLVPEHDQFCTPVAAAEVTTNWSNTTLETVPGNDHFLASGLDHVADAFARFIDTIAPIPRPS